MTVNTNFDVVVAGAGPAGVAAACTLARAGRSVLLVEKRQGGRLNIGETIAPVAKSLVESFLGPMSGALPDWAAVNRGNTTVWGDDSPFSHDFFFNPYGTGICVNRDGFDDALRDVAKGLGVTLWRGTSIASASQNAISDDWEIEIRDVPARVRASYLVDATGRAGVLQKMLGTTREDHDPLMALALRFVSESTNDRDGFSRIEASPYGWWYSNRVPTPKGTASERVVVLHCDPENVIAQNASSPETFRVALKSTQLIQPLLHKYGYFHTGRLRGSIAGGARSERKTNSRFICVGDAEQAFDPLSSQGIQQALQSGSYAGQALHYALANPNAPEPFLTRYTQQMQQVWDSYQADYTKYYSMEQRFPDHSFWRTRSSSSTLKSPKIARDTL